MTTDHYVPRFYLRNFTDPVSPNPRDPYLWQVDLETRFISKRPPGAVAYGPDFNAWENSEQHADSEIPSLEKFYGEIENRAAPVINRLLSGDTALSRADRDWLAFFLAVQMSRAPGARDALATMLGDSLRQSIDEHIDDDAFLRGVIELTPLSEGETPLTVPELRELFRDPLVEHLEPAPDSVKLHAIAVPGETFTPLLVGFSWTLMVAPKERSFLTTDRPVILSVPESRPYVDRTGQDNQHVWVYCPLGRQHALMLQGERGLRYDQPVAKSRARASEVVRSNDWMVQLADRYVYCSNEGQARRVSRRGRPGIDVRRL